MQNKVLYFFEKISTYQLQHTSYRKFGVKENYRFYDRKSCFTEMGGHLSMRWQAHAPSLEEIHQLAPYRFGQTCNFASLYQIYLTTKISTQS